MEYIIHNFSSVRTLMACGRKSNWQNPNFLFIGCKRNNRSSEEFYFELLKQLQNQSTYFFRAWILHPCLRALAGNQAAGKRRGRLHQQPEGRDERERTS
jgi:hypothetical protein